VFSTVQLSPSVLFAHLNIGQPLKRQHRGICNAHAFEVQADRPIDIEAMTSFIREIFIV
jgi:hypothetical protein